MYLGGMDNVPGAPGNVAMVASIYPGRLPLQGRIAMQQPTQAVHAASISAYNYLTGGPAVPDAPHYTPQSVQ